MEVIHLWNQHFTSRGDVLIECQYCNRKWAYPSRKCGTSKGILEKVICPETENDQHTENKENPRMTATFRSFMVDLEVAIDALSTFTVHILENKEIHIAQTRATGCLRQSKSWPPSVSKPALRINLSRTNQSAEFRVHGKKSYGATGRRKTEGSLKR